jgi:hypothetical protein
MEENKETWQERILKALETRGAYTLMLQRSDLQWPKEVNVRRKVPKLAIKRGASIRRTTTQITYTKGWSEGRKRAGERLKIAAKRGSIVSTDKTSAPINDQGQKRKAVEATVQLPSRKEQLDVYSQSGANDFRFTELVVEAHEIAVRVPKYVVDDLEQMQEGEQELDWMLGVVQRSYIDEQSNVAMYDVLFADGIRKCIPSGFTEHILRHEEKSLEPTKNFEAACNTSSDDDSEDEEGSRDGDDSWPVDSDNDLQDQVSEWEAWAQSIENLEHFKQCKASNLRQSEATRMVLSGTVAARTNAGVAKHQKIPAACTNAEHKEEREKQKSKIVGRGQKHAVIRQYAAGTPNVGSIQDMLFPADANGVQMNCHKKKSATETGCGDLPVVKGIGQGGEERRAGIFGAATDRGVDNGGRRDMTDPGAGIGGAADYLAAGICCRRPHFGGAESQAASSLRGFAATGSRRGSAAQQEFAAGCDEANPAAASVSETQLPTDVDDAQRGASDYSGVIADNSVAGRINETTAATIAGAEAATAGEKKILVFDLGGATFDVKVLTIDDGVFEVLSTSGDRHLGGEDFDLLRKSMAAVKKVMDDANLQNNDIHEIVLVGGDPRIPTVQQLLRDYFDGKEPLALGIETVGGVMTELIRKNTVIPTKTSQVFTSYQEQQSQASIQVVEGGVNQTCHELGKIDLCADANCSSRTPTPAATAKTQNKSRTLKKCMQTRVSAATAATSYRTSEQRNATGRGESRDLPAPATAPSAKRMGAVASSSKASPKSSSGKTRTGGRGVPELGGSSCGEVKAGVPRKTRRGRAQQASCNGTALPPVAGIPC